MPPNTGRNSVAPCGVRTSRISTVCWFECVPTPRPPPTSVTTIRWRPSFCPSPSIRKSGSTPWRKSCRTRGCFVNLRQGWLLDLYPNRQGMTLWLIDRNQSHYRLTDSFAPAFYVSGDHEKLLRLQEAAHKQTTELRTRFTERTDLWLNAQRPVLEVSVLCPTDFLGWGRWVHKLDSRLQLYDSDLMVASSRSGEHTSELQSRPHLVC